MAIPTIKAAQDDGKPDQQPVYPTACVPEADMATETAEAARVRHGAEDAGQFRAYQAAMDYAKLGGWPVLPGSAWNGRRYQVPGENRITNGLQPVVPRNRATTSAKAITSWWGTREGLVPSVLLRSGLAFDVLSVARPLADAVIKHARFRANPGPVVYRPDQGRAYFMVTPDVLPVSGFEGKLGEIALLESGSWILVPPARLGPGVNVAWWVTPEFAKWQLAVFDVARELFDVIIGRRVRPTALGA